MDGKERKAARQKERDLRPRRKPGWVRRCRSAVASVPQNFFLFLALLVVPRLSRAGERRVARVFGWLASRRIWPYRRRAETNADLALGGLPEAERRRIVRRSFDHQALVATDYFWFSRDDGRFEEYCEIGDETMRRWLDARGPCFMVTAHLGNWELASRMVSSRGRRLWSVFKPFGSGAVSRRMLAFRERCGQFLIPRDGAMRGVLRALRAGDTVGMVLDQHVDGRDGGVFFDFFGLPASFSSVVGAVAHKMRVPVLVCAMARDEARDRYVFTTLREFTAEETAATAPDDITRGIVAALEEMIRRWPEQWIWSYRRWKRWPPGDDPSRYPDYAREDPLAAPVVRPQPASGPRRFRWPMSADELADFARIVRAGGIAIVPTDTVYGIAAAPERADALARIVAAKGRDPKKPCQLLAASAEAAERAGIPFPPPAAALARAFWPGALTLVLDKPGGGTEGVRVPDHAAARALCEAAGGLLRCTSANRSGEPPATTADAALAALPAADAVVDAGPAPGGVSSTVAAIGPDGAPRLFREGPVSAAALAAALTT